MVRAKVARSIALMMVLLIGPAAAIARANDVVIMNPPANNAAPGSPLLPCPRSVPCLPVTTYRNAARSPAPVASVRLLPCPFSVPCFTTGRTLDSPVRRKLAPPATRYRPIAPRSRSAGLSRFNPEKNALKTRRSRRMTVRDLGGEPPNSARSGRRGAGSGEMALRGDAAYEQRARTLLSEVGQKLGRLDRSRLDASKLQLYAKASDFTTEGFKALRANDNLAALGFAEKAQLLSANLDTGS
jgi:hypothetical protein